MQDLIWIPTNSPHLAGLTLHIKAAPGTRCCARAPSPKSPPPPAPVLWRKKLWRWPQTRALAGSRRSEALLSCGGCESERRSNYSTGEVSGKEPLMAHTISGKHWREHLPPSVSSSLTAALFVGLMWCLPTSLLIFPKGLSIKNESSLCAVWS